MTDRRKPITQRNKGKWCFRGKVWWPEDNQHGSLSVECGVSNKRGKELLALMAAAYGDEASIEELDKELTELCEESEGEDDS